VKNLSETSWLLTGTLTSLIPRIMCCLRVEIPGLYPDHFVNAIW
jgi:hypothetical protein